MAQELENRVHGAPTLRNPDGIYMITLTHPDPSRNFAPIDTVILYDGAAGKAVRIPNINATSPLTPVQEVKIVDETYIDNTLKPYFRGEFQNAGDEAYDQYLCLTVKLQAKELTGLQVFPLRRFVNDIHNNKGQIVYQTATLLAGIGHIISREQKPLNPDISF